MKKTVLIIAAIIIATASVFSQSATETRRIKTTALQIYENYKVVMSDLYSKGAYTEDNFMALFDRTALIYNDIVPSNTPAQLSPRRYFENFKTNIKRIYPVFSDFKMGEPTSDDNKWQIMCSFTRGTRFRTQKDMNYPEWSFNYTMTIEMDRRYDENKKVYENAKIVNIKVDNPLKNFFIIENKENLPLTAKSGETLNGWDKEYNSRIFPDDKWKIYDIQIPKSNKNDNIFQYSKSRFSKNLTDSHFYQLNNQIFKKNIFGIGVNYSPIALGNKMSNDFENVKQTNSVLSLSIFYGKQIFQKEKATGFLKFGLDLNRYSYGYSIKTENDSVQYSTTDEDGDSYDRITKVKSINKKVNFTSMSVPMSFEYVQQLTGQAKKPVFLSFELGLFAEYTFSSSEQNILNANRYGLYDITFKDNVHKDRPFDHYYDYGNFDVSLKQNFAYGIFGGVGLWFTLNNSNLLKFNVSYKHSLNSPLEYKENPSVSPKENSDQYSQYSTGLRNIYFGLSWVKTIGGK